jgi:hypothetical protein
MSIATPLPGVRRKLAAFSALSVVALAAGLPGWTVAALTLTSLAIPVAVGVAGGRPLLRELLGLPTSGGAGRWAAPHRRAPASARAARRWS